MKRFLLHLVIIIILSILPNYIVGILRLHFGDAIPYSRNIKKDLFRSFQQNKNNIILKKTLHYYDMSGLHLEDSIMRAYDAFSFSNINQNNAPEILYVGDSFFDDPRLNSVFGLQSKTNEIFKNNISYNIGAQGFSGFRCYNELNQYFFKQKPKLIVFEVVERYSFSVITTSATELRTNQLKSIPYNNYCMDLIFGNNFQNFKTSRLFSTGNELKSSFGYPQMIKNRQVWFLNNRLTEFSETDLNSMADSMVVIKNLLKSQNIGVVFTIAPDKESLYPELFGKSSLVALHSKMKDRNIDFVDILSPMVSNGAKYYYDGDTHWNQNAVSLLCEKISRLYLEKYLKK